MHTPTTQAIAAAGNLASQLDHMVASETDPGQRDILERMSTEAAAIWRGLTDGTY